MSERRLKLGNRREYKRRSKHTRNPSYYPRHLTKVRLSDLDADYNLPVPKEVAATKGYGRKVVSKNARVAYEHHWGYIKYRRIEKFISKYIGKPYDELCKAYDAWMKPVRDAGNYDYPLSNFFTKDRWRQTTKEFYVDDEGLVQAEVVASRNRLMIAKKLWKENASHKIPDFGSISSPVRANRNSYYYDDSSRTSNGTDPDYYKPRLLGRYWCCVNGKAVRLPVYHVHYAKDYIDYIVGGRPKTHWGTVTKSDTFAGLYRQGTYMYEQAKKLEAAWMYVPIPCSRYGNHWETMEHFRHRHIEEQENPDIVKLDANIAKWQANVEFVREGGTIMYTNINTAMPLSQVENVLHEYERQRERAPRIISLDSGYGQLCPLVKRCDYERVLSEVSH